MRAGCLNANVVEFVSQYENKWMNNDIDLVDMELERIVHADLKYCRHPLLGKSNNIARDAQVTSTGRVLFDYIADRVIDDITESKIVCMII